MRLGPAATESRALAWACGLFILVYFWFFSYHALETPFTFDDGTTVIAVLHFFETPFWRDILNILLVFTSAFRPLTTLFWKPLYYAFGFNPLPYRIVVHILLMANLPLVYVWARRLGVTREAAALTTLLFCYNASMLDLFYNTCLVGDITCFLFYGLAFVAFIRGKLWLTVVYFLLSLDSKEQAVTLPGMLLLYLLMFRFDEMRDRTKVLRTAWLPLAMFVADAVYLKVKVADMSRNPDYNPHVTVGFVLKNIAHNVEQLLYFPEKSLSVAVALLILSAMVGVAFLVRSRQAIFGVLFFIATLIPIAVIQPRAGYAAYIPYFGLVLAIGAILAGLRTVVAGSGKFATQSAVVFFLITAGVVAWGHIVNRLPGMGYYEWSNPTIVTMLKNFEENIPEFPPGARVLLRGDNWEPDWGPMFLVRLMYHDNSIWVDRPKNMNHPPDPMAYDIVADYTPPDVQVGPARLNRHFEMPWELRSKVTGTGQLVINSPHANGAASRVLFAPAHAKKNEKVRVTMPGLSNVVVNVVYRMGLKSHVVDDWCKLDDSGSCTIYAPAQSGALVVDWIQANGGRWIFSGGVLTVVD